MIAKNQSQKTKNLRRKRLKKSKLIRETNMIKDLFLKLKKRKKTNTLEVKKKPKMTTRKLFSQKLTLKKKETDLLQTEKISILTIIKNTTAGVASMFVSAKHIRTSAFQFSCLRSF